ncbi:MAG TPA: chemotaxis protein CheX [Candidatus Avamphibacillus sp.]|nr:chemotaxis protein CheX [Candidatus Avamphibacillus sp.]
MSKIIVSRSITCLLNSTLSSLQTVILIPHTIKKPTLLKEKHFECKFGVSIRIVGDIKGKLVMTGEPANLGFIGEEIFGTPIQPEMLPSFTGELANILAGRLSEYIKEDGVVINISSPTIMEEGTMLSGYKQGLNVPVLFPDNLEFEIYLLLD